MRNQTKNFTLTTFNITNKTAYIFENHNSSILHYESWERDHFLFIQVLGANDVFTNYSFRNHSYVKLEHPEVTCIKRSQIVFKGVYLPELHNNVCYCVHEGNYNLDKINNIILEFLEESLRLGKII